METTIGNKLDSFGKQLNVVIANASEADIMSFIVNKNKSLTITNSLIISVPQTNEGIDIPDSASLWLSDSNGNIMEIACPMSRIKELEQRITALENH